MNYSNSWSSVHGYILGSQLQDRIEETGASYLSLGSEDGHPYIEVAFDDIFHPSKAIEVGKIIEEVFGVDVYLFGIRPQSMNFYVALDKLVWDEARINEQYLNECGTLIKDVEAVWGKA